MSTTNEGGPLYSIYRDRIGQPQTDDEVRGYWVFLVGLLLAAVGLVLFLPSESAVGADGITLREISIILAAIGLAMLISLSVMPSVPTADSLGRNNTSPTAANNNPTRNTQ